MSKMLPAAAASAYVLVAFLTFGYGANRLCSWEHKGTSYSISGAERYYGWNDGCNQADAAAAWLFLTWPIYWGARAAMEVTKP